MDVLADVLTILNVEAAIYYRANFSALFSIAMPAERRHIRFHLGSRGTLWIGLPGGESAILSPGDLILVPHGSAHVLADSPETAPLPLDDMLKQARSEQLGCIAYGGSGQGVELVCGYFGFNEEIAHPLIESLPPLIHVKASEHREHVWLDVMFQQIDKESRTRLPGHQEVLRRLSEIVFIQILRAFLEEGPQSTRFLTALVDPQLRRVLDAIHANPSSDWTLERLAKIAGMSRTVFVEQFRTKLGVTPMKYVADWRLQKAQALLRQASLTVGEVARSVGYESEASFNRAFSQHFGRSPGVARKQSGGQVLESNDA